MFDGVTGAPIPFSTACCQPGKLATESTASERAAQRAAERATEASAARHVVPPPLRRVRPEGLHPDAKLGEESRAERRLQRLLPGVVLARLRVGGIDVLPRERRHALPLILPAHLMAGDGRVR